MPHPPLRLFNCPGKSVCRIDPRFGWCAGCKRTRSEIKAWETASDKQKQAILDRLAERRAAEIDAAAMR